MKLIDVIGVLFFPKLVQSVKFPEIALKEGWKWCYVDGIAPISEDPSSQIPSRRLNSASMISGSRS